VLVTLTNELSTAVTNLCLGPMRRDLGASSAVMQLAVTLGKLMLGACMLAGGVAGDVYGRRRVLVLGALGMVERPYSQRSRRRDAPDSARS
jgi:MFS family permease